MPRHVHTDRNTWREREGRHQTATCSTPTAHSNRLEASQQSTSHITLDTASASAGHPSAGPHVCGDKTPSPIGQNVNKGVKPEFDFRPIAISLQPHHTKPTLMLQTTPYNGLSHVM